MFIIINTIIIMTSLILITRILTREINKAIYFSLYSSVRNYLILEIRKSITNYIEVKGLYDKLINNSNINTDEYKELVTAVAEYVIEHFDVTMIKFSDMYCTSDDINKLVLSEVDVRLGKIYLDHFEKRNTIINLEEGDEA